MVRPPCCPDHQKGNTTKIKKGPWTADEDAKLIEYVEKHGHENWRAVPGKAGLNRCGKSCRLRWINYLRPDIKRGNFSDDEEHLIVSLHKLHGNKWSKIASFLKGRTDNEIKNHWNTRLRKKLLQMRIDPITHEPIKTDNLNYSLNLSELLLLNGITHNNNLGSISSLSSWENALANVTELAKLQLHNLLLHIMSTRLPPSMEYNTNPGLPGLSNCSPESVLGFSPTIKNDECQPPLDYSSWTSYGGTLGVPGCDGMSKNNFSCNAIRADHGNSSLLPGLVSPSPDEASPNFNYQKESCESTPITGTNDNNMPQVASNSIFEEYWEKLMEEDTSASFLRDILI